MGNQNWTLTVSYVNGVATISDGSGGQGDETIFQGETDTITFQPGSGVRGITGFSVTNPVPLPSGVSITSIVSGSNCVVTDTDTLADTASRVDASYCVNFVDSTGTPRTTDPKLINMPTVRPLSTTTLAMVARAMVSPAKPAARTAATKSVRPQPKPSRATLPAAKPPTKPPTKPMAKKPAPKPVAGRPAGRPAGRSR